MMRRNFFQIKRESFKIKGESFKRGRETNGSVQVLRERGFRILVPNIIAVSILNY